jgi:LPXTG-motif cell wall-anchored protein
MLSAAAVTSILSLSGASAFADSEAKGQAQDSPGVLAGNTVQAPLDVPVNACGNTANVAAGLNPAFGNKCVNGSDHRHRESHPHHEPPPHYGEHHQTKPESEPEPHVRPPQDRHEEPRAHEEEASGTSEAVVEVPAPDCDAPASEPDEKHEEKAPHDDPAPRGPGDGHRDGSVPVPLIVPPSSTPAHTSPAPKHEPQTTRADRPVDTRAKLAETGADQALYGASAASAALLLGGVILYRRRTASSRG